MLGVSKRKQHTPDKHSQQNIRPPTKQAVRAIQQPEDFLRKKREKETAGKKGLERPTYARLT